MSRVEAQRQTGAPRARHSRAEAILVRRCREGDTEALEILAYRLAPAVWAAAGSDGGDAMERALRGWRAALEALEGWHAPTVGRLERLAATAVGTDRPGGPSVAGAVRPPQSLIAAMRDAAAEAAPRLAEASRRRRFAMLQLSGLAAALALGAIIMLATYQSMDRFSAVPPSRLAALQFRIRHAGLSTRLRDISWELPDAAAGRSVAARVLESAALALDEIASTPPLRVDRLRYVAWRVAAENLPAALRDLAERLPESKRAVTLDAALALEEVEVWFGAA